MGKVSKFPTEKVVPNSITYPKRITIDSEKGIRVSDNVTFTDVLDLCLNAIVSNAFRVVELTVLDHQNILAKAEARDTAEGLAAKLAAMRKAVTEHLYDKLNESFTYTLEVFAPDIARHPGLSDLAIMKAEDEIIAAYLDSLPEEEREAAAKAVVELAGESKRALMQRIAEINEAKAQAEASFVPLTPAQEEALKILADEEASVVDQNQAKAYLEANPLPCMTPAVEPEDVTSHWQEATKDGKDTLICYHCGYEVEPDEALPLICPGCSREMIPTFSATPTKEELDDCGAICSQCENEACKNSPPLPISKILSGLE